jgi:protein involved in polysaccharide export with SLBB domain/capsular polysaccharide biosynthesis protein
MQSLQNASRANPQMKGDAAPRIDFWIVLDLLARRWIWIALGAIVCGVAAWVCADKLVGPKFTATGQLIRYETTGLNQFLKQDVPMSAETFGGLVCAPDLLQRVGAKASPPIPPEIFVKQIKVDADSESDLVNVELAARNPYQAVDLLNSYLTNAVDYLREIQAEQTRREADSYLTKQVGQMDQDITGLEKEFRALAIPPQITNKAAKIGGQLAELSHALAAPRRESALVAMETERLNQAMSELTSLLSKYTEIHPLVQQKEAEVAALKSQLAVDATNRIAEPEETPIPAPAPAIVQPPAPGFTPEVDIMRTKLLSLEQERVQLVNRQREAELYANDPPGMARVFAPAKIQTVRTNHRRLKIGAASLVGAILGMAGSLILVILTEFFDSRLKSPADLTRVARLPVLTTLGDVEAMASEARSRWAFKTWTLLQGRLSPTANHGLVCGFTSSSEGEGRSTWIRLLAEAASLTGFRVLTVATRPSDAKDSAEVNTSRNLLPEALGAKDPADGVPTPTIDALSSPAQIAQQLTEPNARPVVHIPLPGWVWNRERRQQWHDALEHWRKIENIVILVELPPADMPETVLLGASLPNLIWLAESGANAASTRDQLQTLRDARCNLVGAVFNRENYKSLKRRFPRWVTCAVAMSLLSWHTAHAQPGDSSQSDAPRTNLSFSIVHPWQRAAWQEHLTLGPGDVLNFGLFGQPELAAPETAIGPDGRISFLEAHDVVAAGLTIDELRARLDADLAKYRRAPHTLITPVAFRSKKYYVLGEVMVKGVYVLDRPLTVLEAIARAKGFENGLLNRSVVDLADFSRSFIARQGKRVPLNLEKLFASGDLSQNVPVEPGDYIYFAAPKMEEIYVVGEVRLPGTAAYDSNMSVISAIADRGGFTEKAYRSRVLLVRGSLDQPELFAIDTAAIVGGKIRDVRLEPKDIIYVSPRPFARVEELADLATTAFIQGLITAWVDTKVVKPFNQ